MNDNREKDLFKKGLLFVGVAYILIKCIDQYKVILGYTDDVIRILGPFILGAIFAYAINPISNFLMRRLKFKRSLSILSGYIIIFAMLGIVVSRIIPVVYSSILDLINQIPYYMDKVQTFYMANLENIENIGINTTILENIKEWTTNMLPYLSNILNNSITVIVSITTNTITMGVNIFLGLFISYYMLMDKEKFGRYIKKSIYIIFRKRGGDLILESARIFHTNVGKYLIGKSIDSIFVGVCAMIGLAVLKAQYAVLLGVIFGVTNMVPYVGPIVGTIIAVGINVFSDPSIALMVLVYLLIVQQVESLIIDPKVVGKKLGLNPVLTLLAVSVGGKFFGIVGMVLGAPIVGVIKLYAVRFINKKYKENYE